MNVTIVYPEVLDMARYRSKRREFPPFGALYIASALEAAGHQVKIVKLDPLNLSHDFTQEQVVAFSISASATFNMFLECKATSRFADNALILAGGVHVNLFPEQTLRDLRPDVVGIGEGEDTIVELVNHYRDRNFADIPGIAYLDENDLYVRTKPLTVSRNINRFLFPARHLIPQEDFILNNRLSNTDFRMTHIAPGRGCPFPCRYCASAQTQVQYRSGENIKEELVHLKDTYAIEGFAVVGNDFILSKNNVYDIAESIKDLGLHWATLSRVDRVDRDVLRAMKESGCYELEFGVESGSQRVLDAMDKRATIEQAEFALKACYDAGIKNKVFLVHGFPGEDADSTLETMRFLDKVGKWIERVSLFRFVPLPGTYVYVNAKKYGLRNMPGSAEFDGDWGRFHIHHNHHHWWGTEREFEDLTKSFWQLWNYVEDRWPSKYGREQIPEDQWMKQSRLFAKSSWNSMAVKS